MAGMRDPLTEAPPPSRFDPEELNSFEPTEAIDLTPPRFVVLILALSKVGIRLIDNLPNKTVIGSIFLPGVSKEDSPAEPSSINKGCNIYSCDPELSIILVSVQDIVLPEVSNIWTKVVLHAVQAERVLVLQQLPVQHFRGKMSVDEPMLFMLVTDQQKAEEKMPMPVAPYYPSGSLVDGLAAALLTHCQIRGLKGRLLLTWPSDGIGLIKMLVATLSDLLKVMPEGENIKFVEAGTKLSAKKAWVRNELYI